MTARTAMVLALAVGIAASGCAKKKPKELPPPPPSSASPTDGSGGYGNGAVGNGAVSGSRADFIAQAGTDTVHFATDSSDVDGEAQRILAAQARWLSAHPQVRVTVEGHCDERGTREYNLALGERRANSAKNALVGAGVSAARINVISYGKERPAATGSDEGAWAENRRAVTVVPQ